MLEAQPVATNLCCRDQNFSPQNADGDFARYGFYIATRIAFCTWRLQFSRHFDHIGWGSNFCEKSLPSSSWIVAKPSGCNGLMVWWHTIQLGKSQELGTFADQFPRFGWIEQNLEVPCGSCATWVCVQACNFWRYFPNYGLVFSAMPSWYNAKYETWWITIQFYRFLEEEKSRKTFALQSNPCWGQGWLEMPKRNFSFTTLEQKWWFVLQMFCHAYILQRFLQLCILEAWKDRPLDVFGEAAEAKKGDQCNLPLPIFHHQLFQNRLVAHHGFGCVLRCYRKCLLVFAWKIPRKSSQPSSCPIPKDQRFLCQEWNPRQNWQLDRKMIRNSATQSPKLKTRAAETRALVPWACEICEELLDPADNYEAGIRFVMRYLLESYKCLSRDSFEPRHFQDMCFKFLMQYHALEIIAPEYTWFLKPKFHSMAELALSTDNPSMNWVYRDEECGGTLARLGRSRGSVQTPWSVSSKVLQKFAAEFAVPVFEWSRKIMHVTVLACCCWLLLLHAFCTQKIS